MDGSGRNALHLRVNVMSLVGIALTSSKLVFHESQLNYSGSDLTQKYLNLVKVMYQFGVPVNELDQPGWYVLYMLSDSNLLKERENRT